MSYSQQDSNVSWIENRKLRKALDEAILQDVHVDACAWPAEMEAEPTIDSISESMVQDCTISDDDDDDDDDDEAKPKPGMCDAETQTPRAKGTNGCPPRAAPPVPSIDGGPPNSFWLSVRYQSRVFAWRWSREMLRLMRAAKIPDTRHSPDSNRDFDRLWWHVDVLDRIIDSVNAYGIGCPWLEDQTIPLPPALGYGATAPREGIQMPFNPYETFTRIGRCWCDWENWILAEVAAGRARSIIYDQRHQFRTPDEHWDAVRHYVPIKVGAPAGVPKGNCFRIGGQECRQNGEYHHRGLCFLTFGTEAEIDAEDPKHQKQ